jgi:hypothetical protein
MADQSPVKGIMQLHKVLGRSLLRHSVQYFGIACRPQAANLVARPDNAVM